MSSAAISRVEQEEDSQPSSNEPGSINVGGLAINDNSSTNDPGDHDTLDRLESNESNEVDATLAVNEHFDELFERMFIMQVQHLNETSKDRFQYGWPLREKNIRLIQLHSGSGDDPIVCSMMGGPLKGGSMPFEAVSYVWGSEENPRAITCNWAVPFRDEDGVGFICPLEVTNNMKVTENLYRLLLRLRLHDQDRTLWIDQICIDQDKDPEKLGEKMNQVRMMAEVYSAAENVLIWLGEEDSETATAFGMLKWSVETEDLTDGMVGNLLMQLSVADNTLDQAEPDQSEDGIQKKRNMDYLRSLLVHVQPSIIGGTVDPEHPNRVHITFRGSRAMTALLERPWFGRSWTFQEAISARRATIICGSHQLPWEILYRACKSIQPRRMMIGERHHRINSAFVIESTIKKGDLQRDWARLKAIGNGTSNNPDDGAWLESMAFHRERRIKRLLPLLRSTACKDPRDKVLALLGIAHDDFRRIVFPDYRWPVVNLYTCIVSYWIQEEGRMDISFLNHVQDSSPEHNLPSWVPDWSIPALARPLIELAEFSAAGDTVPEVFMEKVNFLEDLKPFPYYPPIIIEGFYILEVQAVEADLGNYERHAEMLKSFENPYPMTELSYLEAHRRTIYPNIPQDFAPQERATETPSFREYINNYNSKVPRQSSSPSSSESEVGTVAQRCYTAEDLQSQIPNGLLPFDDNSRGHYHTYAPAPGRAFFASTTGFIGLCPKNTQPGDKIYILLGGATPFVIRVLDDGDVRFVGECFVLGLMHGEAMEGRPKKRVFVIMR